MTEVDYNGPVRRPERRRPPNPGEAYTPRGIPLIEPAGLLWPSTYIERRIVEGTGHFQAQADNAVIISPIDHHNFDHVGDEKAINEAYLTSPVVKLTAGQVYHFHDNVYVPAWGKLYLNTSVVDRSKIKLGHGACIVDDCRPRLYMQDEPPDDPQPGQLWVDTSDDPPALKMWDGHKWVTCCPGGGLHPFSYGPEVENNFVLEEGLRDIYNVALHVTAGDWIVRGQYLVTGGEDTSPANVLHRFGLDFRSDEPFYDWFDSQGHIKFTLRVGGSGWSSPTPATTFLSDGVWMWMYEGTDLWEFMHPIYSNGVGLLEFEMWFHDIPSGTFYMQAAQVPQTYNYIDMFDAWMYAVPIQWPAEAEPWQANEAKIKAARKLMVDKRKRGQSGRKSA